MPDVKELGRKVKAKYPGKYDDLADEDVGRRVKAKYPGAYDDFTDTVAAQPGSFTENLKVGAARGALGLTSPVEAAGNIVTGLLTGDTQPLKELGKGVALGVGRLYAASQPGGAGAVAATQAAIDQGAAQRQQQQFQQGDLYAISRAAKEKRLAELEAKDPSIAGKLTRGVVSGAIQSAPYVAAGGAGIPGMAATGAAMSLGEPENIPVSAGLAALPLPVGQAFKAGVNAVRRAFGKGAAQIVEAEALPAATAQVRRSIPEVPPVAGEASSTVQRAMQQFEAEVQRIKSLPPGQQAAEMDRAIGTIGREAAGGRPAPTSVYPPMMVMPEKPNAIQQAGVMPRITRGNIEASDTFKQWFKGGKVVDKQGNPAVVYRGANRDISEAGYKTGPVIRFSSDPGYASGYGNRVFSGYVNLKNPLIVKSSEGFANRAKFYDLSKEEVERLTKQGYDGIIIEPKNNPNFVGPFEEVIAFNQNQFRQTADFMPEARLAGPSAQAEMSLPKLEADLGVPSVKAAPDLPYTEAVGPRVGEDALNAAVSNAAQSVPRSVGQRVGSELLAVYHLPRSLLSSLDLSAPFRQGALLTVPPTQWGRAARAGLKMFQAFSTKKYGQIVDAIATHADAPAASDAGLYLATKAEQGLAGAEEAFLSKYAGRIPLVKQSEQAYKTYLDSLRMDTFAKYKRVIDAQGLTGEQAQRAYQAAATWINYATGRGSLGQTLDKAMPALSTVIFSPRFVASRLNVLNPLYYAKNAATAEGRVVLKQQMGELVQYAGVVAGTLALAKAAGADVTLNPNSPDFLKIKAGRWRYDMGAGLQQVMRLIYRAGGDIKNKAIGEKTQGPNALEISGNFLRSKLAPVPGAFVDFIKGRTVTGKPFSAGEAVVRTVAPIQWADFVEAYQKEGLGGILKASPGFVGFGVQDYDSTPVNAAIEKTRPLFNELERLNRRVSDLRKKDGEKDDAFNARVQQFSGNYTLYGQKLLDNPRFQAAPDAVKGLALDALNSRAKALTNREFAFPELDMDPNALMDAAENSKKNPANK